MHYLYRCVRRTLTVARLGLGSSRVQGDQTFWTILDTSRICWTPHLTTFPLLHLGDTFTYHCMLRNTPVACSLVLSTVHMPYGRLSHLLEQFEAG